MRKFSNEVSNLFTSLYYGLFCSLYHVDDGIDWQDIQCKLGVKMVRKEIIYVTKEDIQMPGLWVRDRNI